MTYYTIANWAETYETAETRKRKSLFWVLVPNAHDSLGFCSIMEREDGLEVFGAWVLILQVASKCSTRGSLTSSKGRPYSAAEIATITRAPVKSIQDALDVLVGIGWINADTSEQPAEVLADPPDKAAENPEGSGGLGKSPGMKKDSSIDRKIVPPKPPKGESKGGESGITIPSPLSDDEAFVATWEAWGRYQKQSGNRRWGPEMQRQQLEHLQTMTPEDAVTSLCDAMLKGWQGPAKVNHSGKSKGETLKPPRVTADKDQANEAIQAMKEANV
jgi:hypothetical protein